MKKTPKKATKKAVRGRPRGIRFGRQLQIRLTADQDSRWTAASNAREMNLSVWIRDVIDRHLEAGGK